MPEAYRSPPPETLGGPRAAVQDAATTPAIRDRSGAGAERLQEPLQGTRPRSIRVACRVHRFADSRNARGGGGLRRGELADRYKTIVEKGGRFHLSGDSSKARGLTDSALAGRSAASATPSVPVRLAPEADKVLVY